MDASQLLSILRGPPQAEASPAPPPAPNQLDRLFGTIPTSSAESNQLAAAAIPTPATPEHTVPAPQLSLLALLQQSLDKPAAPSNSPARSSQPPAAAQPAASSTTASPIPNTANATASAALLARLMSPTQNDSPSPKPPSPPVAPARQTREEIAALLRGESPSVVKDSVVDTSSTPPVDSPAPTKTMFDFVSPFDLLSRTPIPDDATSGPIKEDTKRKGRVESPAPATPGGSAVKNGKSKAGKDKANRAGEGESERATASSPAIGVIGDSRPTSGRTTPFSSDPVATSSPHAKPAAQSSEPSTPSRELLSSLRLPASLPPIASAGLSLPPSAGRHLSIDVSLPHLQSLSTASLEVAPITLFKNDVKFAAGRRCGAWEKGISYATKQGKIRVIDRVSGARLLLKGHEAAVTDMAVAQEVEEVGGRRLLASIGEDSKLIVWRVPNQFEGTGSTYDKVLQVQGNPASAKSPRFRSIAFHPHTSTSNLLLVACDALRSFLLIDLAQLPPNRHEGTISENEVYSISTRIEMTESIADFSFSPDGSAIIFLAHTGNVTILPTADPTPSAALFRSKLPPTDQLESVQFVSLPDSRPVALAVSSRQGTRFQVIPLGAATTTLPIIVDFTSPPPASNLHFGHSSFHANSSTLFISSSSRGSLFALHLAITDNVVQPTKPEDAAYFAALSSTQSAATLRIDHVLEISTPEIVISFLLDDSNVLENELSAICVHPNGIHQIAFAHQPRVSGAIGELEEGDEDNDEGIEVGPERRMSLEGCISVAVETEVRPGSPAQQLESVEEVVVVKIEEDIAIESSTVNVPTELLAKQETVVGDTPVVQGIAPTAKASRASKKAAAAAAAATIPESNGTKSHADLVNAAWTNGRAASPVGKKAAIAGGGGKDKGKEVTKESEGSAEVLKELRKLEATLPAKIAKIVQEEMEKQAHLFESDRAKDLAAESGRQETMLQLISSTLTDNTAKLVETHLKEQIKSQVIPSISRIVENAVGMQIAKGIADALAVTLPPQLEKLLKRPEISTHLTKAFTTAIAPSLEKSLTKVVTTTLVPNFANTLKSASDAAMHSVRQEMVEVRKEIVREQSGALAFTEAEIVKLRQEVIELKAGMGRMELLLSGMAIQRATPQLAVSTPIRPTTPIERYEELFTNALQPLHEPHFISLIDLIRGSPSTRLDAVFPSDPVMKPRISYPVILSLAFRLSQMVARGVGNVDDTARVMLTWIRKSLTALDGKDQETLPYVPKILDQVIAGLGARGHLATLLGDRRGADELKTVEHYARSRLNVMTSPPTQVFRR